MVAAEGDFPFVKSTWPFAPLPLITRLPCRPGNILCPGKWRYFPGAATGLERSCCDVCALVFLLVRSLCHYACFWQILEATSANEAASQVHCLGFVQPCTTAVTCANSGSCAEAQVHPINLQAPRQTHLPLTLMCVAVVALSQGAGMLVLSNVCSPLLDLLSLQNRIVFRICSTFSGFLFY